MKIIIMYNIHCEQSFERQRESLDEPKKGSQIAQNQHFKVIKNRIYLFQYLFSHSGRACGPLDGEAGTEVR